MFGALGPVAEQLVATGLWAGRRSSQKESEEDAKPAKRSRAPKSKVKGDKTRVNIVSEKLCDDILSYIGYSLDRHKGCDILDLYPGAGLWSRKLHDYLKPRSHILMEPDSAFYEPFLKPLLDRPGTTLLPMSGIVWRDLNSILTPEYLPHQSVPDADGQTERNDTLLVTANIAFHPKKRFNKFDSLALLVIYQFIDAIRTSGLFQRYGLVRMLIWTRPDDKFGLIPKVMQKRRRMAVDSELSCEWVREVCGREGPDSVWFVRDSNIDTNSNLAVWKRMRSAGLRMPQGRESEELKEAVTESRLKRVVAPGSTAPVFKRPFQDVLSELEAAHQQQVFAKGSENYKTMRVYRWRLNSEERKHQRMLDTISGLDAIHALYKSGTATAKKMKRLEEAWDAELQANPKGFIDEFTTYKDNLHYYRQDPPLLHWDRREYHPMAVQPEEFLPNIQCSLLDVQPKKLHPLLRQMGPNSSRAGDCFELIARSLMSHSTLPVDRCLNALAPGAAEFILPRWKSASDLDHGGVRARSRLAQLTPRMLNARQWEELLELWMEWPFRPEFHELLAHMQEEIGEEEGGVIASD
ncbi:hypothetical protein AAE478_009886 [Parahypoxylon ruwenzoriense]